MTLENVGRKIDNAVRGAKNFVNPNFRITYSLDGTLFYIASDDLKNYRARYWLGVAKIDGAATSEMKANADKGGPFGKPIVQFDLKGGEVYCRQALPFAFWDVKSGEWKSISTDDELFKDYASFSNWPEPKRWVP